MHQDSPKQWTTRFKAMLPAIVAFLLCVLSLAPAQAQVIRIEPVNPGPLPNTNNSQGTESTDPTFRVTLTGGDANTDYPIQLQATGLNDPFDPNPLFVPRAGVDFDNSTPDFPTGFTLRPGQNRVVTLDVYDDASYELIEERLPSVFSSPEVVRISVAGLPIEGGRSGVSDYRIIDNDPRPTLRIRDTAVAIADRTNEARFIEGNTGTNNGQVFTVELIGVGEDSPEQQPGFRNNENALVRVTSYEPLEFDYDFQNGNGSDPTNPAQAESQRAPDSASLGTDFNGSFNNQADGGGAPAQIPAGQSNTVIRFRLVGDNQDENNETFIARVRNPRNPEPGNNGNGVSSVANSQGTTGIGVILDDDAPVVTVSDSSVTEGGAGSTVTITFRVELSRTSVQPVYLDYFTGTSNVNDSDQAVPFVRGPNTVADYVPSGGGVENFDTSRGFTRTVIFNPGETLQFVNITVNGDSISEGGADRRETFGVFFAQNNGLSYFPVLRNNLAVDAVYYDEIPETVQRGLTFANNDSSAQGTIIDDDNVSVSINDVSIVEGDTGTSIANFTVSLTAGGQPAASENTVTVTVQTQSGVRSADNTTDGAIQGDDFLTATQTSFTIPAGQTSAVFPVEIQGDNVDERNETFLVNLSNASQGAVIADNQGVGTIIDNDGPTISINDPVVTEGNTGTTALNFTVSLSAPSPQPVSVNFRTQNGGPQGTVAADSSGANPDFTAIPQQPVQTLTIPAGQTTGTFVVNVNGDTIDEQNEVLTVALSGAVNAAPNAFTDPVGVGTINDDDDAPVVSIKDVRVIEGQSAVFTVSLSNPSAGTITVNLATLPGSARDTAPNADFTPNTSAVVTFNGASFNAAGETTRTIAIPTIADTIDEVNETFTLDIQSVTNSDANLGVSTSATDSQGLATIVDDDGPSVSVADAATVTEGDPNSGTVNATFPVTLSAASPQAITLNYTLANGTAVSPSDFNGTADAVTIPAGSLTGSITVAIAGDLIAENTETFTLTITVARDATAAADEPAAATITRGTAQGTIRDNDTAGISVTPTTITTTEAAGTGHTATFTVVLTSQPTGDVTIPVSSSDLTEATVSTDSLVFTRNTFSTPQTVRVTGFDDVLVDGTVGYTIVLGAAQSSDPFYARLDAADVVGTTTDNDIAALSLSITSANIVEGATTTATVSRNTQDNGQALLVSLTTNNANVTIPASVTIPAGATSVNFPVSSRDNAVVDGPRTSIISATAAGFTASNGVLVTVSDDDSAGVVVTPTTLSTSEGGTSTTFSVRLTSQPSANVTISFVSSNVGEVTVAPASITFAPATFSAPQTITVTGVDDDVVDGVGTAVINGTITSGDPNYSRLAVMPITVNNADNDRAGFTVTPVSGLRTDETGRTATFTVSINSTPTAVVTVAVASTDTTEGSVFPGTLTFGPQDRGAKTVTVTGLDDLNADGDVAYRIVLSPAVSNDDKYLGVDPADVAATNIDNDTASVVVSTRALTTTELGGTDAFTVNLTSQPIDNVTINAFSTDTTEGATEPSTLIFTPANYATPQTVRVRGINDLFVDGSVVYGIRLGVVSQDAAYANQVLPTITATNLDNDTARVVVTVPASGIRVNESGTTATFTVSLVGQPQSNVTLPLSVDKPGEATLSTSLLTFTPQNYSTPKTVTVRGKDDFIADGNQSFTITLGPTRSSDAAFNLLRPTSVRGVNSDNDRAGVSFSPTTLALREGGRGSITIRLLSQPTAPVVLTLRSSDTTEVIVPTSVTLNASNYARGVAVPITAVLDGVVDGQTLSTIRVVSQASSDPLYNVTNSAVTGARVTVSDADVASIRVSPTALTVDEGGSTVFQVSLGARPSGPVRVLLGSSAPEVGTVSPTVLIFTPANFNVAQRVTVRAVNNNTVQATPATFTIRTTSAGSNYSASGTGVVVTVIDDDDATPPVVTIESPANGGTFQTGVAVTGLVSEDRRVARLTVEVARLNAAGNAVAYLQNSGVFSSTPVARTVPVAADGSFRLALPRLELGRYRVTAVAFDQSNNRGQDVSTFTISDAPTTIAITSPRNGGALNPNSVITGTVTTRSTLTGLTLTLRSSTGATRKLNVRRSGTTFTSDAIGTLPQGTYTITASASDALGNVVSSTVTVLIDNTPPTSVAITNLAPNQVVDNLFEVRGRVTDTAGGSGLGRVELVIKRRTDEFFFNGRTFQRAATTVRATITGNTFVYTLPSGLPADPDPLNAVYSLQAIAFDRAGNGRSSAAVNILLSTNGNAGGGTGGTVVTPSTPSTVVAQVPTSPLFLSTKSASETQVSLSFSGALDGTSASDVASYEVSIGGQLVKIEGARSTGGSVTLSLPSGEASVGDTVTVAYDLRDAQGRALRGQATATVR